MSWSRVLPLVVASWAWVSAARATVLFENTGVSAGWDRLTSQHMGTITEVMDPHYKGPTALRMTQVFQGNDGVRYHAEAVKNAIEKTGESVYFGQALYIPPDWVFHDQNVTFQQFAPDDNSGPWVLMFVQNDHLQVAGVRGAASMGHHDLGAITNLRGTWIRIVTHIMLASAGAFEVWVNGTKVLTVNGSVTASGPSIRWSSGIYCTGWWQGKPAGPSMLSLFHAQFRAATTLAEADPAGWGEGMPPPPSDGGSAGDDAGGLETADAGVSLAADAAPPPIETDAAAAAPDVGPPLASDASVAPGAGDDDGGMEGAGATPSTKVRGSGCAYGAGAPEPAAGGLALVAGLALLRRLRRAYRPSGSR